MAGENTSLRSAGWVSLCSLGQLVLQFWFQMLLAKQFGASWEMDAYVAAIALPTVISAVLVGSLSYAFVPLFGGLLTHDAGRAWRLAGSMGIVLIAFTAAAALGTFLMAGWLVATLFPGFSRERFDLAVALLRILCWLIVANGLIGYLQSLYHCHQRFLVPAAASPIGIAVTVAGAIAFRDQGMVAIAWAVLAGSFTAVALQTPLLFRHGQFGRFWNDDVRRCFVLLLPLVLGALYFRLDPLVDRYLTSMLPVGNVSHLGYAWRI
ncbi:MAG: lipid II flippase MurJ, partial [Thermoguttaceae bacterium]